MAKVIDICLDGHYSRNDIKEFNVCLGDRVKRCDIIVDSIIYKDYFSVSDAIILESCLEDYILQKMFAASVDTELVSHINQMIKTCYEKINAHIEVSSRITEGLICALHVPPMNIELGSELGEVYLTTCASIDSILEFASQCQDVSVTSLLALARHETVQDSNTLTSFTTKEESVSSAIAMIDNIAETIITLIDINCNDTYVVSQVEFHLGRYRALYEMDDDTCSVYDNMALGDVDFIIS